MQENMHKLKLMKLKPDLQGLFALFGQKTDQAYSTLSQKTAQL